MRHIPISIRQNLLIANFIISLLVILETNPGGDISSARIKFLSVFPLCPQVSMKLVDIFARDRNFSSSCRYLSTSGVTRVYVPRSQIRNLQVWNFSSFLDGTRSQSPGRTLDMPLPARVTLNIKQGGRYGTASSPFTPSNYSYALCKFELRNSHKG